jgi:nicotinate-nucleotide--dimethylbenzimidazole phosphoribosyltransferase
MNLLEQTINKIAVVDAALIESAARHQLDLTKPPGSLGRLEDVANRCAAIRGTLPMTANHLRMVIFAADHGVCQEGVSMYPQAVTAQMVANFHNGGAAINAFARALEIELKVVDVGVGKGTRNFCLEPAMTHQQMMKAIEAGIEVAIDASVAGFGEMGIGNTTSASAITAALTGEPVEELVGTGTGADADCMEHKRSAVRRGLALHKASLCEPLGILQCVGGFEIAAMCGFCLGCAARRVPVVMDGFIATAAAALALRLCPALSGYLFAAHRSVEPGHSLLLAMMDQEPLLDLGMRLGEGTGAALAMKLVQASIAAFTGMATFSSAGVSNK